MVLDNVAQSFSRQLLIMKQLVLLIVLALASNTLLAQNSFSTLEEKMTGKEFMAAGLDKLTPEELAALNNWLRRHSVATLDAPTSSAPAGAAAGAAAGTQKGGDQRGFENQMIEDVGKNDIVARIMGPFKGWDGETVFRLDNGMIWKQSEGSTFAMAEMDSPTVIIERGLFNVWKLRVQGYNKSVKVERLQ